MARRLRRHHRDQFFQEAPAFPEDLERLIEHTAVLALLDEHRMQRRVEIFAVAEARGFDRGERVEHRAGAKRHARFAQRPAEMDNVLGERSPAGGIGFGESRHALRDLPRARAGADDCAEGLRRALRCGLLPILAREIGFHRREIEVAPTAVLVIGLAVGHAGVGQRQPRSGLGRLEFDRNRRIPVVAGEVAGAPRLDDAPAGHELKRRADDVAVPGGVGFADALADPGWRACHCAVARAVEPGVVDSLRRSGQGAGQLEVIRHRRASLTGRLVSQAPVDAIRRGSPRSAFALWSLRSWRCRPDT